MGADAGQHVLAADDVLLAAVAETYFARWIDRINLCAGYDFGLLADAAAASAPPTATDAADRNAPVADAAADQVASRKTDVL